MLNLSSWTERQGQKRSLYTESHWGAARDRSHNTRKIGLPRSRVSQSDTHFPRRVCHEVASRPNMRDYIVEDERSVRMKDARNVKAPIGRTRRRELICIGSKIQGLFDKICAQPSPGRTSVADRRRGPGDFYPVAEWTEWSGCARL